MSASNVPPRAVILGCEGPVLSDQEKRFFAETNPFGFILFGRNVKSPEQIRSLTASLRDCVGRNAPILIDQEGGRVRRLRPPHWRDAPPMRPFGRWYEQNPQAAQQALTSNIQLMADELLGLGIDVDCAPVMDVPVDGAHDIIGDRAFSLNPKVVGELGKVVCDAFLSRGVYPVIKHIPGHGRATEDSHLDLPVVTDGLDVLTQNDFLPFLAVKDAPFAMTAHIVYTALDDQRPATLSPTVVSDIIRGHIGFDGLLMTDDLSMKALKGDFTDLAKQSMAAGCDLLLHCNGDMAEMKAVIAGSQILSDRGMIRWLRAQTARTPNPNPLPDDAENVLAASMAESGAFVAA